MRLQIFVAGRAGVDEFEQAGFSELLARQRGDAPQPRGLLALSPASGPPAEKSSSSRSNTASLISLAVGLVIGSAFSARPRPA